MIPVDESRLGSGARPRDERVRRPEVAVQQGVGAAERLELMGAPGQLGVQPGESAEQARAYRALLRRRVDLGRDQRLEDGDGVPDVGGEERPAETAAIVAAVGEQGMAGGA